MKNLSQENAPIYEALERFRRMRIVPFDVPGHKHGRGNKELVELLGERCVSIDVNSMKPLDNLCHPVSVIKNAEQLAAEAFHASHAFLMVGGTTSSVQAMVLSCCKNHITEKCTPQCDQRIGVMRSDSDLCQSGCGAQSGNFTWYESVSGRTGDSEASGCGSCICEQSDVLRNLF